MESMIVKRLRDTKQQRQEKTAQTGCDELSSSLNTCNISVIIVYLYTTKIIHFAICLYM